MESEDECGWVVRGLCSGSRDRNGVVGHGNDLGGSLRVSAAFKGIVGLRPGPGVVARGKRLQPFDSLWVEGPMGRSVADVALMLDAQAGHDREDPFSFPSPEVSYSETLNSSGSPKRVAFSRDLGVVHVSKQIAEIAETSVLKLRDAGIEITGEYLTLMESSGPLKPSGLYCLEP